MIGLASSSLTLPYPPSTNHYWRHVGPKVLISEEGRAYRNRVSYSVLCGGWAKAHGTLTDRLAVSIVVNVPDNRRRDLDNVLKSLLDALTHARVWEDDSQIDRLTILRGAVRPPGSVDIVIAVIEGTP